MFCRLFWSRVHQTQMHIPIRMLFTLMHLPQQIPSNFISSKNKIVESMGWWEVVAVGEVDPADHERLLRQNAHRPKSRTNHRLARKNAQRQRQRQRNAANVHAKNVELQLQLQRPWVFNDVSIKDKTLSIYLTLWTKADRVQWKCPNF